MPCDPAGDHSELPDERATITRLQVGKPTRSRRAITRFAIGVAAADGRAALRAPILLNVYILAHSALQSLRNKALSRPHGVFEGRGGSRAKRGGGVRAYEHI